jgi:hypothetical protein
MAYYDALKATWATLPSSDSTAQKLAAINAMTVAGPNVDVPVSAVVGYLGLNGRLSTLSKYAGNAPATSAGVAGAELVAIINCPNAPDFASSNSTTYQIIQEMLTALAGDANSGISSADVTNLLGLAATTIRWWEATVAEGGGGLSSPVTPDDLAAAGGLT